MGIQFSHILANDKFLPDGRRIRVQEKPETEDTQGQRSCQNYLVAIPEQESAHAVVPLPQIPPGKGDTDWNHQDERFVQETDTHRKSGRKGHGQTGIEGFRTPLENNEKRQKEPEDQGGIREKGPAVAVGAEKAQKGKGRHNPGLHAAGKPPGQQQGKHGGEKGIDDAWKTQVPEGPVASPVRACNPLPEEERRLGIAHLIEPGPEREHVPALSRHPGNVGIGILVAVLRDILAVQGMEIDNDRKQKSGRAP